MINKWRGGSAVEKDLSRVKGVRGCPAELMKKRQTVKLGETMAAENKSLIGRHGGKKKVERASTIGKVGLPKATIGVNRT